MEVGPSKDDEKTGMVAEITEYNIFFYPWVSARSLDNAKRAGYRYTKGVVQIKPQDKWRELIYFVPTLGKHIGNVDDHQKICKH